jgi:hypothetical protein
MLFVFRFSCSFTFCKHKQQFVYILKKTKNPVKWHQYGYQMKGLGLEGKNMLSVFRFSCLFTFHKHKRLVYILKNARTSIWVSNERSRPRE